MDMLREAKVKGFLELLTRVQMPLLVGENETTVFCSLKHHLWYRIGECAVFGICRKLLSLLRSLQLGNMLFVNVQK